jgi:hypothetical protein
MDTRALQERYGASEHGNYRVVDKIGTPHPYCITAKHVGIASDQFGGMLGKEAILAAEKQGAKCGICHGKLSYDQHEQALLVECKAPLKSDDGKIMPELHQYLLKCKPLGEEDHFAGFAFKEA